MASSTDELWWPKLLWNEDEYIRTCNVVLPNGERLHIAHSVNLNVRYPNIQTPGYRVYVVHETGQVGERVAGADDELTLRCVLMGLANG